MACLLAASWIQLSISAGNGWPHNALQHHWLMPISCHFRDCKVLLVMSLTHVSELTFSTGCQYLRGLSSRSLFSRSTVSMVLALPTSKMSACLCWILLLGALSTRLSVVTCLFLEQERRRSVDGVSQWLLQSSGIHYRLTYDHH